MGGGGCRRGQTEQGSQWETGGGGDTAGPGGIEPWKYIGEYNMK
jgi:hypothetical protein